MTRAAPSSFLPSCLVVALVALAAASTHAERLDGVAAVVGDEVILHSEVDFAMRPAVERMQREQGGLDAETAAEVRAQALQSLIDGKLLEAFAERMNLGASPEDVDSAVAGIAEEEGVSPEDIYAAAAQEGLSRQRYREELRRQITRMKVVSTSVRHRVTVSEAELREAFESRYGSAEPGQRVVVRHILLPFKEDTTEGERANLRELSRRIRERVLEGGSFGGLARQFSAAPSAPDGGRTTFREGEVAGEIAGPLFKLPLGEVTEVLETAHGLNLFLIEDRYDPSEIAFDDVAPRLRLELLEAKTGPEFAKWLRELRKNQYIEILASE